MYIAIFQNQNEAVKVYNLLKRRGLYAEIIATPRRFASAHSCSYCLKFSGSDINRVRQAAKEAGLSIQAIYKL